MPAELWMAEKSALFEKGLTKNVRTAAQPETKLRDYVKPIEKGFGKGKGDQVTWSKFGNVATAGGKVNEADNLPETNVPKTTGNVTVVEFGNSIPYSGLLEALSTLPVDDGYVTALANDYNKVIDNEIRDIIRGTNEKVKYVPGGTPAAPSSTFRTDGTYGTYTRDIRVFDFKEVADQLHGVYKAPKYDGGRYVAIVSTGSHRSIFDDPEFKDAAVRSNNAMAFYKGEVGEVYGIRFVAENNAFDNTTNGYRGEFVVFGGDWMIEAIAQPMVVRRKSGVTTFGRFMGVGWYLIGGWQIVWNTATAGEARVVAGRSV